MQTSRRASRVLVVDDEPLVAGAIARIAESFGHDVVVADAVESALERFRGNDIDVVLTDVRLGEQDGLVLLREIQALAPEVPVVLITGQATIGAAMEAIHAGAYDYLAKPPVRDKIGLVLKHAVEKKHMAEEVMKLKSAMGARYGPDTIVGSSVQMLEVFTAVARVAKSKSNVLILGESGTGKELVARSLHRQSDRSEFHFVPVNVAAVAEGVLESELFGHVRGAFTGATSSRHGLFREAHRGTLFLDEIGDLSLTLQAKLLRAIQARRVKPVGGDEEIEIDVRLVVATNRDLDAMVERGQFREDLYYRVNVVSISLPSLRERPDDIPLLVEHFLRKYESDTGQAAPHLSNGAHSLLMRYPWPGNVRELENVVERAALYSTHGVIGTDCLPPRLHGQPETPTPATSGYRTLDEIIDSYVSQVLDHTGGNVSAAARILGVSRRTLHRMAARKQREGAAKASGSRDRQPERDKLSHQASD